MPAVGPGLEGTLSRVELGPRWRVVSGHAWSWGQDYRRQHRRLLLAMKPCRAWPGLQRSLRPPESVAFRIWRWVIDDLDGSARACANRGSATKISGLASRTSFGEAAARTQATDPTRGDTLRVRSGLPGLRGDPKWLARRGPYAVQCQSSDEKGCNGRRSAESGAPQTPSLHRCELWTEGRAEVGMNGSSSQPPSPRAHAQKPVFPSNL